MTKLKNLNCDRTMKTHCDNSTQIVTVVTVTVVTVAVVTVVIVTSFRKKQLDTSTTVGVLGAAFCDSRNVSKVKLKIGTY